MERLYSEFNSLKVRKNWRSVKKGYIYNIVCCNYEEILLDSDILCTVHYHTVPSLLVMQEGITAPMTMQENRIADLQNANIVLIRGLESAKEEAEVLRQELSNSMGMKEESMNTLLMDLEASRKSAVQYETKVAELQVGSYSVVFFFFFSRYLVL